MQSTKTVTKTGTHREIDKQERQHEQQPKTKPTKQKKNNKNRIFQTKKYSGFEESGKSGFRDTWGHGERRGEGWAWGLRAAEANSARQQLRHRA